MNRPASLAAVNAIDPGKVQIRHLWGDSSLRYFLYVPRKLRQTAFQYVSVHGISRNAGEHARLFAPLADQYGVVLVAPLLSRRDYGDYQRLGRTGSGRRADQALQRICREVESLTGAAGSKIRLFGFSGGGQFAHRYTMAFPEYVERVVIGAAGWYTYPDDTRKFPYGTAPTPRLTDLDFDMKRFLQVPACVLVGQWDIRNGPGLNQAARIRNQQGTTRLERGRRWIEAMNRAAMMHGTGTPYEFSILPGVDHDFTCAMNSGKLGQRVFSYLFGADPSSGHRGNSEPVTHPECPASQAARVRRMARIV